ncbi:hypothetical protein ACFLZI_00745 [Nitrospirota bacterium]
MKQGVYKRPDSANYWICYAGLDGKKNRESTGTTKFREADALLIKRKQAIQTGMMPKVKRIKNHTFNELATPYLKWAERQRGFRSKKGFIKQLTERFGTYPLRRISTLLVEEYQTERTNGGNKPATINRHIATLKHMIAKAVDWEMVEEETLKRIRKLFNKSFLTPETSLSLCPFQVRCSKLIKGMVLNTLDLGHHSRLDSLLTFDKQCICFPEFSCSC